MRNRPDHPYFLVENRDQGKPMRKSILCVCCVALLATLCSCSEQVEGLPPTPELGPDAVGGGDIQHDVQDEPESQDQPDSSPDLAVPDAPAPRDDDQDGIPNSSDNCPVNPNEDQADADQDGIGDVCDHFPTDPDNDRDGDELGIDVDNCPEHGNPDQLDSDEDGIGDVCDPCPRDPGEDIDGDEVCTHDDNCPNIHNPDQLDSDEDGAGDACGPCELGEDDDDDGVCDPFDNCSSDPNPDQRDRDGDLVGDLCDICPDDPDNDVDTDGWCANEDNCPIIHNPEQGDRDSDLTGDVCDVCPDDGDNDIDADGWCADEDNCPIDHNPDQIDLDEDGIGDGCDPILSVCEMSCGDEVCDEGEDEVNCPDDCWDSDRPHVIATSPAADEWEVPENLEAITITFDSAMDADSISISLCSVSQVDDISCVSQGNGSYDEETFTVTAELGGPLYVPGFTYEARVSGANTTGQQMSAIYSWRFCTATLGWFRSIATDSRGRAFISGFLDYGYRVLNQIPMLTYDLSGELESSRTYDSRHLSWEANVWVRTDAFGNIYIARQHYGDLTVRKIDPTGRELWVTEVSQCANRSECDIHALTGFAVSPDGTSYLTGFNDATVDSVSWSDGFLISLDTHGDWRWYRQVHQTTHDIYGLSAAGIAVDANENVYMGVDATYADVVDQAGNRCVGRCVLRYDSEGNGPWMTALDSDLFPRWHISRRWVEMGVDGAGNLYLVGLDDTEVEHRFFVAKFTADLSAAGIGEMEWHRSFPAPDDSDRWQGMAVDPDGNVFVVGYTHGTFPNDDGYVNGGDYNHSADMFLAHYDADGEQHWIEQIGRPGVWEQADGVAVDPFGRVLVLGYAEQVEGHEWFIEHSDHVVSRFGPNGQVQNQSTAGNGVLDPGEVCDDGNLIGGDGCSPDGSSEESCGNGIVDPGEGCDDGNTVPEDGCSDVCQTETTCGNGLLDSGEMCDDCNATAGDGCSFDCVSDESCGNGIVDDGEACDDQNTAAGDGCAADCLALETDNTGSVIDLELGNNHSCALFSDHTVGCWGYNADGQVGDGTNLSTHIPTLVTLDGVNPLAHVNEIAAGYDHSCGLIADGSVVCWGSNASGQLGNSEAGTSTNTPVLVIGLHTAAVDLDAGAYHTCAVMVDGSVSCWGSNILGQLGNGSTDNTFSPTSVTGLVNAVALAAGQDHTCALVSNGTVHCWGSNEDGMLGDLTETQRLTPVLVERVGGGPLDNVVALDAGRTHTCALLTDSTVSCWGWNYHGQLGILHGAFNIDPVNGWTGTHWIDPGAAQVIVEYPDTALQGVIDIALGEWSSCAVRADGSVFCWGLKGCAGNGRGRVVPVNVWPDTDATGVALGGEHMCIRTADGRAECWGFNYFGQLGLPLESIQCQGMGVLPGLPLQRNVAEVASGQEFSCALYSDGTVDCWGGNDVGQLGTGSFEASTTPQTVDGLSDLISVVAGSEHACALTADGRVQCWGNGRCGRLGDGWNESRLQPVEVVDELGGPLSDVAAITAGYEHTCALISDGTVRCWGSNDRGQLGAELPDTCHSYPSVVTSWMGEGALESVTAIEAGLFHTCATYGDGEMTCWGANRFGQLGGWNTVEFEEADESIPVLIPSLGNVIGVTAGWAHTCALLDDGSATCWGLNDNGQLGGWTGESWSAGIETQPVEVRGLTGATTLVAGAAHTCALMSDGGVTCWGNNSFDQFGDGTGDNATTPIPISLTANVTGLSAGWAHNCAVDTGGSFACWGFNDSGQLGNGSQTDMSDGYCGNGSVDAHVGEVCDDGNQVAGDGCSSDCRSDELCGNRIVDSTVGETCDDGNEVADDGCAADCLEPEWGWYCSGFPSVCWTDCGDERVADGWEACDDGNNEDEDGCAADCSSDETCGNWLIDETVSEVCDDGNEESGDGCSEDCLSDETCGNWTVDDAVAEVCDDGNEESGDGCSSDCLSNESCGNFVLDTVVGETCDDGNVEDGDGCSFECQVEDSCGNGVVDTVLEACDDSNNEPRDGCSPACQVEDGWVCDEATPTGCESTCGDEVVARGAEDCDDGNEEDGDGCSSTCQNESNGIPVAAGLAHTCAITGGDQVVCWGNNDFGQLGNGTYDDSPTPVTVVDESGNPLSGVLSISANGEVENYEGGHTCALTDEGFVLCWGDNGYGQLGNEDADGDEPNPVLVTGLEDGTAISVGTAHACAVRSTGSVTCWGDNYYGQLGDGTDEERYEPVFVVGIENAIDVSAGHYHTCALLENGTANCWGENLSHQLGNGTDEASWEPVQVLAADESPLDSLVAIAASSNDWDAGMEAGHTCAVRQEGTVFCWGDNLAGQLGIGTSGDWVPHPTQVSLIDNAIGITAGLIHTCALLQDGSARCWGDNSWGQLGDGTADPSAIPAVVLGPLGGEALTDVTAISVGGHIMNGYPSGHSCAVLGDRTEVVCWGDNLAGQLGNVSDLNPDYCDFESFCASPVPVPVEGFSE